MAPATTLPALPMVSLDTAKDANTAEAFKGRNTVIDFWTTKCTRCPAALDKLNAMASSSLDGGGKYTDVDFVSICCGDSLDGAREIIEQPHDAPKWSQMSHYFMNFETKEEAKKLLGFTSVPFYVFVDKQGNITHTGSATKVDFSQIPGALKTEEDQEKENVKVLTQQQPQHHTKQITIPESTGRVFELDDDF